MIPNHCPYSAQMQNANCQRGRRLPLIAVRCGVLLTTHLPCVRVACIARNLSSETRMLGVSMLSHIKYGFLRILAKDLMISMISKAQKSSEWELERNIVMIVHHPQRP